MDDENGSVYTDAVDGLSGRNCRSDDQADYDQRHDLKEMLVIAFCATLSDIDRFEDVRF